MSARSRWRSSDCDASAVRADDGTGLAELPHDAALEQERAVAEAAATASRSWLTNTIVLPSLAEALERGEALLLEALVADREHLVEQEDVEVDLDRDRVGEPHLHPGREVLQLLVDEALELGERDDVVEALRRARVARGRAACR